MTDSLCLEVYKSQQRSFGKISFCLARVDGLDIGTAHFMQEDMNRMVFWAGKSLKSMKLLIESEKFLVGLTARWQICIKFHRIQRNYSASFSDTLQGLSQWEILVFNFLALEWFSKLENFSSSPPLPSLCSSILSSVSGRTYQAVCGWTPGRSGTREPSHMDDEQKAAGQREERPNFALSHPRAISEPGYNLPCRLWRSTRSCPHSAAPRIVWFISVSLSVFPF